MDNEMLTTDNVREAFVEQRSSSEADLERERAAFDRWLTEMMRLVAEKAWRDGYYTGKRDYVGSVTGGRSISTPNPYSVENIHYEQFTRVTLGLLQAGTRIRGSIGSNE